MTSNDAPSDPDRMQCPPDPILDERKAALDRREETLRERETALREREEERRAEVERCASFETQNSELRQANEHLVLATIEAQELREAALMARHRQDEFLAMLGHELRNPLGPICNAVEILARVDDAQPIRRPVLDIIRRQVQQMVRLLDDLLDVARVTQGKVALQRRPTQINECIHRAVEAASDFFKARDQQFTLDFPAVPLHVDGDALRLVQVFSNLLQNASKYTQAGGSVSLRAERVDESVVIRVIDNGMGISPEALPYVFDLFVQDERTKDRSEGGLGIGLTVVRRMVELHEGTVDAYSSGDGQGSEFVVTLPRLEHRGESEIAPRSVELLTPTPARVLLIEDNVDAGEALGALLSQSGHEVEVALDGQAGLNLFERFTPDVVLCDIGLPGLDGYEVAIRMRELRSTNRPVMVALTGYGNAEDQKRSLDAGFDHHVVKPGDPKLLLRIIHSARLAGDGSTMSASPSHSSTAPGT